MHISDIENKTAANISAANLDDDPSGYHRTIQAAAFRLVQAGLAGFRYQTQWSSGATLWGMEDRDNTTLIVHYDGSIEH